VLALTLSLFSHWLAEVHSATLAQAPLLPHTRQAPVQVQVQVPPRCHSCQCQLNQFKLVAEVGQLQQVQGRLGYACRQPATLEGHRILKPMVGVAFGGCMCMQ
jgi:hypothetical protein